MAGIANRAPRAFALVLMAAVALPAWAAEWVTPDAFVRAHGFAVEQVSANGTEIHTVRGGDGPALVLIHGFPQDWYSFRHVMPLLAGQFTVVALDLRGVGRSAPVSGSYAIDVLLEDVRQVVQALELGPVLVAGQDNGGMVAYAYARRFPAATRGAVTLDVPLPGLAPWGEIKGSAGLWHFGFHQTPELPETLIAGREFAYFRSFFDRFAFARDRISDAEVEHAVGAYRDGERLAAGLAFYRQTYASLERLSADVAGRPCPPMLLLGGEHSMAPANPAVASALADSGCQDVRTASVPDSGHWVVNEQPDEVATLLADFGRSLTTIEE